MSEDCHDSNNENPFRVTRGDMFPDSGDTTAITVPCKHCGEPVSAEEAYPCELENPDGTTEIAVFHRDIARMCPYKWAAKRIDAIIDETIKQVNDILNNPSSPS